jgi:hypothetical protein
MHKMQYFACHLLIMKMKFSLLLLKSILFAGLCLFSSSLKKEPAAPPDSSAYDPQLAVTCTIAQLQTMPQAVALTNGLVISGVVTMNDEQGNYFNKIVIQDNTGGIEVCLHQSQLYRNYPVGRKVYIKCDGLFLGNDHGNLQLGMTPDETGRTADIPQSLIENYVVKANYPNEIKADTVSLATLSSLYTGKPYLNKLVVITQAEFTADQMGVPYAQSSDLSSFTFRTLQDCSGKQLQLKTSAYARFQPALTPAGNGFVTGIYTRNNFTPQLYIRDTADVKFYRVRCDGTLPDALGITPLTTIRNLCPGLTDSIESLPEYKISGIVISDKDDGNTAPDNVVIQQGERGIVIHLDQAHLLDAGDSIVVNIHLGKLSWLNGLLQISNVSTEKISKAGSGKTITPRLATIAQLHFHYNEWESTLVKISNATIGGMGTYSGSKPLTDASGSITLYTRSAASFAGAWISHEPHNITGILSRFNDDVQLQIRNLGDVD